VLLEIQNLDVFYGGLRALTNVNVSVKAGEFVTIIGPNGAGKTTLFKTISGTVQPRAGRILFEGEDILTVKPAMRARRGIAHVPEGRQVFKTLTVQDNLEMGALAAKGGRDRVNETFKWVFSLLPRRENVAISLRAPCRAVSSRCSRSRADSWGCRGF
jgi:branched-chain amino acid transport system ATP-binding protein